MVVSGMCHETYASDNVLSYFRIYGVLDLINIFNGSHKLIRIIQRLGNQKVHA